METISILWKYIHFKDFLDVIIVSFLVYNILLLMKGTRAVQILIGICFLIILAWISYSLKMYSLGWILDHFFEYFFILVVIIFQDQIRGALANFGAGKIYLGLFRPQVEYDDIEEVVEVASAASKERIGTLIVFENQNGLSNYIATGSRMNCEIHSDLIYAIFQSRSSLHDGAIIIGNGRIKAAGCLLPLSKNVDIERHLGTRHRAGIGITEVSDAVSVIVSEETGRINVAFKGSLYLCSSQKELRMYLKQILSGEDIDLENVNIELKGENG